MKKVLLTTTAMAFAASMASAGDMSMSGSVKLTYGSFGTGTVAATGGDDFTSEADLDIAATSAGGNIQCQVLWKLTKMQLPLVQFRSQLVL